MRGSLLYLTVALAAVGVTTGIQCFQCSYEKNDHQESGTTDCRRPDVDDERHLLAQCVYGETSCTWLTYTDKATKREHVSRGCGTCTVSNAVPNFGTSGDRQCCTTDNCNTGNMLHARALLVTFIGLLTLGWLM